MIQDGFNATELSQGIQDLKDGKASGVDNITVEQIKHFGPRARRWLLDVFNYILEEILSCLYVSIVRVIMDVSAKKEVHKKKRKVNKNIFSLSALISHRLVTSCINYVID